MVAYSDQTVLEIARVDFANVVRTLAMNPDAVMVGRLVKRFVHDTFRLSVGGMTRTVKVPLGIERPLNANWIVAVGGSDDTPYRSEKELREIFLPLPGQSWVVLSFGFGNRRGQWRAWLFHGTDVSPIGTLKIAGGPYLLLRNSPINDPQTPSKIPARWSRLTNMLGSKFVESLRDMHVMVIGASRNGSVAARQLATLGIGKLTLVDPDVLEIHNFDAMLGGDLGDIGNKKVSALANEITRYCDDIAVTGIPSTATDLRVAERAQNADVLVTCVDHGTPVLLAAQLANCWNKIHLDIGTSVQRTESGELTMSGDVRLFLPRQGCAACVGGIADREDAELELRLPPGVRPIRPSIDFRQQRAGSLVTLNAITVSIGIQHLIDTLTGRSTTSRWSRVDWRPDGLLVADRAVSGLPECKWCGINSSP